MLTKINAWANTVVRWFALSSADPTQASATIKFALLWLVPWVIKVAAVSCGIGIACLDFLNADWLNQLVGFIGNAAYFLFALAGTVGALYGFIRKVVITFQGKNRVIAPVVVPPAPVPPVIPG